MERKRKLPARAAARVEHEAKRRNSTPRERSEDHEPTPAEPRPPPLPRSVEAGKPLPTVEDPQDDLASKDFQSIGESGVLAESLSRSRNRWINDGLFEKYWTKPHKRKGVINEDPKNPPKDSMTKAGTVTITIEPHTFEATMYIVRDTKSKLQQPPPPPPPQQQVSMRPIIQYGPPGGSMPSQIPDSGNASPAPQSPAISKPPAASPTPSQPPVLRAPSVDQPPPPPPPPAVELPQASNTHSQPAAQPQRPPSAPTETTATVNTTPPGPAAPAAPAAPTAPAGPSGVLARPPSNPPAASAAAPPPGGPHSAGQPSTIPGPSANPSKPTAPAPGTTPGKPAANDPSSPC